MKLLQDKRGQGTVEFALVAAGFIALVVGLSVLWKTFESGLFVEHALASASHHVHTVFAGAIGDVFLY